MTDTVRMRGGLSGPAYEHALVFAAYGRHLAFSRGGRVLERDGMVACNGGFSSLYRNLTVLFAPKADAAVTLRAALQQFYGRPTGWTVWDYADLDLRGAGLTQSGGECTLMSRSAQTSAAQPPADAGLVIEDVRTDADVAAFEGIREGANGRAPARSREGFLDARSVGGGHRMWLGRLDGKPVAGAASFRCGDSNLLMNVAVLPHVRSRGFGAAMSAHAAAVGGRCFLYSRNPGAIALYRRLGFSEIGHLRIWEPAPGS